MSTAPKYLYKTVVLHIELKNFTLTEKEVLQGLTVDSEESLRKHGEEGWELVAVMPYEGSPRSALGFFKRPGS